MVGKQPMTIKRTFFIIIVFLLVLTSFRVGWILYHQTPDQPHVEEGIIDLSDWIFDDKQTITLDGEWEFYPNKLLKSDTLHTVDNVHPQILTPVPGKWGGLLDDHQLINYGTYRAHISLPDREEIYGIRIEDISSAASVYVDGKLIAKIGEPAKSARQNQSKLGTYKAFFHADTNEVEMIIQVSNYENAHDGGITESIKFGTEQAINREVNVSKTMQLMVAIILIVHSIYAFGLYFIGKGKLKKEIIYFGLLLIFAAFSILVDEDKLLLHLLQINATWSLKLLYVSFAGTVYFMVKFIKHAFRLTNNTFRFVFALYQVLVLLLFLLPFQYITYVGYCIMLLNAFSYVFMFIQILRIIRSGNRDAIYILFANLINFFNVLWGIAINVNMLKIPYYPFDYLIAIMAFAGFLLNNHLRIVDLNAIQTKELQLADKKKDEFLANTSHELRNPLHGIINISETILNDQTESLSTKTRNSLELLSRLGKQMTFTLNDILDITRLQEQRIKLNEKKVNLHATAAGVLDMVRFMTEGKNLDLYSLIPPSFPKVHADESRLVQILFNLIHNAVKFTNEGSVTIRATHKDNVATIIVSDTGIGMTKNTQQMIFQRYQQEDSSPTFISSGIGLGLHICKQLVQLHGGEISVESQIGQGSTFFFTIPLADMSQEIEESVVAATLETDKTEFIERTVSSVSEVKRKHVKILVVDDDPVNLRIIRNILDTEYDIYTASNGYQALELLDHEEWDLIVSDVMMPNMSGYKLTEIIRRRFSLSELPILLLTARNQAKDIYTGFQAGANDYISKPMDRLELKARVKALTTLKQSILDQLRMEAAWLQAQIQPHFLYNTLNTIASLAEVDTIKMVKLLHEFGNYLRRSFDTQNTQPLIELGDELDITRSYLFIKQARFGDRLHIEWDISDQFQFQIPPLSIQPIVENAIRHGLLKRRKGGTVRIQIIDHKDHYKISIHDDGVGMNQDKIKQVLMEHPENMKGIGIANTNQRLRKLYGKGLSIISKPDHGTTVAFEIPK